MRRSLGSIVIAFAAASCSDGGSGPSLRIANVFISAPTPTIAVGDKAQLTAVALDSVGNTVNATFAWSSSADIVAIVSSAGLVTGVTAGTATISAKAGSATGTLSLTVRASANLAVVTMPPGDVFTPFQVIVPVGGTVRWEFPQKPHNVIFDRKAGAPTDIQSTANAAVSRSFTLAGTFPYDCTLHPGMSGEVIVR